MIKEVVAIRPIMQAKHANNEGDLRSVAKDRMLVGLTFKDALDTITDPFVFVPLTIFISYRYTYIVPTQPNQLCIYHGIRENE